MKKLGYSPQFLVTLGEDTRARWLEEHFPYEGSRLLRSPLTEEQRSRLSWGYRRQPLFVLEKVLKMGDEVALAGWNRILFLQVPGPIAMKILATCTFASYSLVDEANLRGELVTAARRVYDIESETHGSGYGFLSMDEVERLGLILQEAAEDELYVEQINQEVHPEALHKALIALHWVCRSLSLASELCMDRGWQKRPTHESLTETLAQVARYSALAEATQGKFREPDRDIPSWVAHFVNCLVDDMEFELETCEE